MKWTLEELGCLLIWGGSVVYSLACFALASKKYQPVLDQSDFTDVVWFPYLKKDASDFEWTTLRSAFTKHWYLIVFHVTLSQVINLKFPKLRQLFYAVYGTLSAVIVLNARAVLVLWFNVLLSLAIQKLRQPVLCYISCIISLYLIHKDTVFALKPFLFGGDNQRAFLFEVAVAWLNAKCLSFSLDSIRSGNSDSTRRVNGAAAATDPSFALSVAAYCFYFPPFFTGPIYQYKDFAKAKEISVRGNIGHGLALLRFLFWALFLELLLHFVYSSAMQYYPEMAEEMDAWTLCGFGYALPCLFYLKYLVIYGVANALARFDGVDLPPPPECVTRIHLSSHLWRTFDRGLHLWLTNYIYKPCLGSQFSLGRRIFAAGLCFSFVCLWHGFDRAVIAWCTINFLVISFEMLGAALNDLDTIKMTSLTLTWRQRFEALMSAPFFAIMIISNIFFLSNWDLGCIFVRRILMTLPLPFIPTICVMYAGARVSMMYLTPSKSRVKQNVL